MRGSCLLSTLRRDTTLVLGLCAVNVRAQAGPPYTKEAIVGMLKGEVSPHRVAVLARQRGIDFRITPEVESESRQAGATVALLATLREIAPTPPKPPEKPTVTKALTLATREVLSMMGRARAVRFPCGSRESKVRYSYHGTETFYEGPDRSCRSHSPPTRPPTR